VADLELLGISTIELLGLWADLIDAEYGTNGFGGDTAELYAYRFGALGPTWYRMLDTDKDHAWVVEAERESSARLYALLALFRDRREVDVEIDGRAFGDWLKSERFGHRVHVRVIGKVRHG
jgi:hypothetical protein